MTLFNFTGPEAQERRLQEALELRKEKAVQRGADPELQKYMRIEDIGGSIKYDIRCFGFSDGLQELMFREIEAFVNKLAKIAGDSGEYDPIEYSTVDRNK